MEDGGEEFGERRHMPLRGMTLRVTSRLEIPFRAFKRVGGIDDLGLGGDGPVQGVKDGA